MHWNTLVALLHEVISIFYCSERERSKVNLHPSCRVSRNSCGKTTVVDSLLCVGGDGVIMNALCSLNVRFYFYLNRTSVKCRNFGL